jgi:hypothetical protein
MNKRRRKTSPNNNPAYWTLSVGRRTVRLVLDKVLFLRFLRSVHGRYWGITAISGMVIGFSVCFLIRPDLLMWSTAFSDFGNDVRTAPFFAGTVFFTAYGLWRWRRYLARTWKRTAPVTGLISLTIIGLYLVALMPISWKPIPYYIHLFGVTLAGLSMLATVVIDSLLTYPKKSPRQWMWRGVRIVSLASIIAGGWITFGSADIVGWNDLALLGESLLLLGYFIWIVSKTYQTQGRRTLLAKFLHDFVLVD